MINLASRFIVLRDVQHLLSSPCMSTGICHRNCPAQPRHPSLALSIFFIIILSGSPLLSALPHFRAELQGRHGGRPRSWPGSS